MDAFLSFLVQEFHFSGSIPQDVAAFLNHHNHPKTAVHAKQVADTAARLARRFGVNPESAALAGWLHDISAVFPNKKRLKAAQKLGLEILPEEVSVPLLLHQKISTVMAKQLFHVEDQEVLNAIGCHTTLKSQPSQMDLVLFVADKLTWDQKGTPPYANQMQEALSRSLEEAAWVYQDYLMHSGKIKIIHSWMRASHQELQQKFG
jgi:predicted HD superfamily hydrolase involved in NAD metabolism